MKRQARNILAIAGVIGAVVGIVVAIPSFMQARYIPATGATILIVGGLVLLAIAFGED